MTWHALLRGERDAIHYSQRKQFVHDEFVSEHDYALTFGGIVLDEGLLASLILNLQVN
jgi:hypothetical protein